jgi:signal transduction histidine kinase
MRLFISIIPLLILTSCVNRQEGKSLTVFADSLVYVDSLNHAGTLLHEKDPDSTFYFAKEARTIAQRLNYQKGIAASLNNLGIVFAYHNNPQLALHYFNDAYNIYQNIHDTGSIEMLLMNMSLVLSNHGKKDKAFTYMNKALSLSGMHSCDSITALVLSNFILNFIDTIPKDTANKYLAKAKNIFNKSNDLQIQLLVQQANAAVYFHNNQSDSAVALLHTTLSDALAGGDNYQSINILAELGNYYFKSDTAKALPFFKQALGIAESKNYNVIAKRISGRLYNFYTAQKNIANTSIYAAKLIQLNRDEEARNNISGVDYLEYALKDKQLEEAVIKNKKHKITIIGLSIASVLFLALIIFIYLLYRLNRLHAATLLQLNRIVTRKNEQLQSNHAFNNTIISILAHDFRQPLIAIGTLSTLLKNIHSLPQQRLDKLIETMEESAETSLSSFKNILQYIKPQLAGFVYEPVSFNLQILVDEVVHPFLDTAKQHHITLQNMVAENIRIEADKEMIQFINRNLIHNAVKFSPEHSTITISAKTVGKEIIVSIDDEGRGIQPDTLHNLFYFKNESEFDNRKNKGAGIALIICKDLIERMNGRIWAENAKEKGAVFYYALPVEVA